MIIRHRIWVEKSWILTWVNICSQTLHKTHSEWLSLMIICFKEQWWSTFLSLLMSSASSSTMNTQRGYRRTNGATKTQQEPQGSWETFLVLTYQEEECRGLKGNFWRETSEKKLDSKIKGFFSWNLLFCPHLILDFICLEKTKDTLILHLLLKKVPLKSRRETCFWSCRHFIQEPVRPEETSSSSSRYDDSNRYFLEETFPRQKCQESTDS